MRCIAIAIALVRACALVGPLACEPSRSPEVVARPRPEPAASAQPVPAREPSTSPVAPERPQAPPAAITATVGPTKIFAIQRDRARLGGHDVKLWGIRWGNALMSPAVTERHVRNLDNLVAHGINTIGVYLQGSNGGWPDPDAGENGYAPDGTLDPAFAQRLELLVREADARGMVVMVGLFSPRKDQQLRGDDAVQRAVEQTARLLVDHQLSNVFVDIMHEYAHDRIDLPIFEEPDGEKKKAQLTAWFHAVAPDIPVGICPTEGSSTGTTYPGMDVRMIQKEMPIPKEGFVVNVEMQRHDPYDNDGKFEPEEFVTMRGYFQAYRAADNAALLFHAAFTQGVTGKSGTGPHPEMGGYGKSEDDRGVRFYFEWVRDNVGRWQYPRHVPA